MTRLLIHVEGQTEEAFVNDVLRNHLVSKGYHSVAARILGNARLRDRRGGIRAWPSASSDITRHLREDRECLATTMVDYYGLPLSWPGRERSNSLATAEEKARCVEDAVKFEVIGAMGDLFDPSRFEPFVVMHEFEALLFSDCASFSRSIGRSDLEVRLQEIRHRFASPEDIDDSPDTAPSKRIARLSWLPEASARRACRAGDRSRTSAARMPAF
jgi:hypothetical protein